MYNFSNTLNIFVRINRSMASLILMIFILCAYQMMGKPLAWFKLDLLGWNSRTKNNLERVLNFDRISVYRTQI